MTRTPKAVAAYLSKIGRKGGTATTPAKQAAARANGAKGGRPKTIHDPVEPVFGEDVQCRIGPDFTITESKRPKTTKETR